MTHPSDIPLLIQEAAPDEWNAQFLSSAHLKTWPQFNGAHVADILDILHEQDWECGWIEDTMDAYEEEFAPYETTDVVYALIYAKIAYPHRLVPVVHKLARKKGA